MAVNSVLASGVQGLQLGISQANKAGANIARAGTTTSGDNNDLTNSLVDLKSAEQQVKASAQVIKSADDTVGTLIDLKV
jgi:hypothetical protein